MYTGYKVVLVETGEPKHTEEVTGLGTVALPCQLELMTFLGNLRLVLRLVKANMYHQHTSNAAAELAHVRAHSKSNFFCSAQLTDALRCIMGRKHPILQEGPTKLLCPPACTWRRRLHTGPASHVRALQEHKRGPQRSGHIPVSYTHLTLPTNREV